MREDTDRDSSLALSKSDFIILFASMRWAGRDSADWIRNRIAASYGTTLLSSTSCDFDANRSARLTNLDKSSIFPCAECHDAARCVSFAKSKPGGASAFPLRTERNLFSRSSVQPLLVGATSASSGGFAWLLSISCTCGKLDK